MFWLANIVVDELSLHVMYFSAMLSTYRRTVKTKQKGNGYTIEVASCVALPPQKLWYQLILYHPQNVSILVILLLAIYCYQMESLAILDNLNKSQGFSASVVIGLIYLWGF